MGDRHLSNADMINKLADYFFSLAQPKLFFENANVYSAMWILTFLISP